MEREYTNSVCCASCQLSGCECLEFTFCAPCAAGTFVQDLPEKTEVPCAHDWCNGCLAYTVLPCTWLLSFRIREKFNKHYKLNEDDCTACCKSFFCPTVCNLAQMRAEFKNMHQAPGELKSHLRAPKLHRMTL